jgi:hypothetical protein
LRFNPDDYVIWFSCRKLVSVNIRFCMVSFI